MISVELLKAELKENTGRIKATTALATVTLVFLSACAGIGVVDGPVRIPQEQQNSFVEADLNFWSGGTSPANTLAFERLRTIIPEACSTSGEWQGCLMTGYGGAISNRGLVGLALHTDGSKCRSGIGRWSGGSRQTARLISSEGGPLLREAGLYTTRSELFDVCERLRTQE